MKKIDLFDTFENAEDELMEDFTDMSPEISNEKLDKLLAVSERNYEKKKAEIERTRKADNTDDENMVRGVERVKRPVWLRPAAMAASFVLIAGTVIGSIVLFNRDKSKKDLFNSDDLSNTDNGALPDGYADKEALIELCSNATKHYDKIEATYVHVFSNSDYIRTTNTKLEYDVKGNYLFADEKERQDSLKGLYSASDSRFVSYFYNNKGVHINNEETFEVSTYEDDWYKKNIYILCEDFYDPKYIFSTEPDSYIGSERIKRSDTWSITGKDTVCGRECVVVETEDEYGKATEYIDAETGVELKYVYDGNYDDEKTKFEVTDINYNDEAHVTSPLEIRQRIEENGYESFVRFAVDGNGNRVDPAVVNNLDFLGIPDKPFTTAAQADAADTASGDAE